MRINPAIWAKAPNKPKFITINKKPPKYIKEPFLLPTFTIINTFFGKECENAFDSNKEIESHNEEQLYDVIDTLDSSRNDLEKKRMMPMK